MKIQEERPVSERRREVRVRVPYLSWVADVRCDERVQKAIALDVGQNSMGLQLERDLPVGSRIELCVALPGQRTGFGRGDIVRVSETGPRRVGITLLRKSPMLAQAIDDCLPRPD